MITNTKVLVVEDNKNMRQLLIGILSNIGFKNVSEAENGRTAWDMTQKDHYDLLITDLMMPEMDGLELLEKIRTGNDQIKNTPVLMINSSYQDVDIAQALKWKVNGYITKPYNVKTVLSKIKEIVR
jgi:two-component system, chemotaxis family, chemotaxis protein CheY